MAYRNKQLFNYSPFYVPLDVCRGNSLKENKHLRMNENRQKWIKWDVTEANEIRKAANKLC